MKKHLIITVLIVFILLSSIPISSSQGYTQSPIRRISIPLLAVRESGGGTVINVTIEMYYPGEGDILIIDPHGIIGEDTRISIKYALIIASVLQGVNYKSYDYKIIFPEKTNVEGTSATLSFLLGFTYLFKTNYTVLKIGSTGLVSPALVIGNVSGLKEKIEAGLSNGLEEIIGPINPVGEHYKVYKGFPDVYSMYRELELAINYSKVFKPVYPDIYFLAFNKSYHEFMSICKHLVYEYDVSSKTYSLAEKYYSEGKLYVAASYAFRAYVDILSTLYTRYYRKPWSINKIYEWINGNISSYMNTLEEYVSRIKYSDSISVWVLDALMNSYIRYMISKNLMNMYNESGNETYLILSLARIQTAKHWLGLISNITGGSITINSDNLELVAEYVNTTIKYFASMKYIDEEYYKVLLLNVPKDNLLKILYYTYILYILNINVEGLPSPIFNPYNRYSLSLMNKSIYDIMIKIYYLTGHITPSFLSAIDIIRAYNIEGERLSIIGSIISSQLLLSFIELMISSNYHSILYNTESKGYNVNLNVLSETLIITSLLIIAIGSFAAGYGFARYVKSSRESSADVSQLYSPVTSSTLENHVQDQVSALDNREQQQDDKL